MASVLAQSSDRGAGAEFFLDGEPLENLILDQTTTVSERGENVFFLAC